MPIRPGDKIPDVTIHYMGSDGPKPISTAEWFSGVRAVLFALPGAFTPTCSASHLPGYVVASDQFFDRGVDKIGCLSVNDAFVMHAWGQQHNVEDRIWMLADGSAAFSQAVGLEMDLIANGMGIRSQRYALLADDGVVRRLQVEAPGEFKVSDAASMLDLLH